MVPGISMVGSMLAYANETVAGTKPSTFAQVFRVQSFGGITLTQNQVEVTATDDIVSKFIGGRQDTGGTVDVVVYVTPETMAQWDDIIDEYYTSDGGKLQWYELYVPGLTNGWFFKLQPPRKLPSPELTNGDDAYVLTIPMIINEYVGKDTAVKPTEAAE